MALSLSLLDKGTNDVGNTIMTRMEDLLQFLFYINYNIFILKSVFYLSDFETGQQYLRVARSNINVLVDSQLELFANKFCASAQWHRAIISSSSISAHCLTTLTGSSFGKLPAGADTSSSVVIRSASFIPRLAHVLQLSSSFKSQFSSSVDSCRMIRIESTPSSEYRSDSPLILTIPA